MRIRPRHDGPPTFALVTGGGTAGHVQPALAVAEALVARGHEAATVRFLGSRRGMEGRLVPEAGFEVTLLPGRGIQRRLTLDNLGAACGLAVAGVLASALMIRRRPRVVVTLGGYAGLPGAAAAILLRVPLVVVSYDAVPGASNRLVARYARTCAVAYSGGSLPNEVVTGAPVRSAVLSADRTATGRLAARAALDVARRPAAAGGGGRLARRPPPQRGGPWPRQVVGVPGRRDDLPRRRRAEHRRPRTGRRRARARPAACSRGGPRLPSRRLREADAGAACGQRPGCLPGRRFDGGRAGRHRDTERARTAARCSERPPDPERRGVEPGRGCGPARRRATARPSGSRSSSSPCSPTPPVSSPWQLPPLRSVIGTPPTAWRSWSRPWQGRAA